MSKPRTAEEVLGLFRKQREWPKHCEGSYREVAEEFLVAYDQWQAAQGPVTREWFVERFGGFHATCENGLIYIYPDCRVDLTLEHDCHEIAVELVNPTRSDIEALVEMLGGES